MEKLQSVIYCVHVHFCEDISRVLLSEVWIYPGREAEADKEDSMRSEIVWNGGVQWDF